MQTLEPGESAACFPAVQKENPLAQACGRLPLMGYNPWSQSLGGWGDS